MMAEGYGISSWRDESVLGLNGGNSHTDLVLKLLELYANDYKVILPYTDCKKHTSEVIKMWRG